MMKLRLATPAKIIDLKRIPNLTYIREAQGGLRIGALTTESAIENSPLIREKLPLLAEAAGKIGDRQVRNRGTIGGTICHADPAADMPVSLLALNAEFVTAGPQGERVINAGEFFEDFFTTTLQPTEILTEIRIPILPKETGCAYIKHNQRESDFALVGVAAILRLDSNGKLVKEARIALGAVGRTPLRARSAENHLAEQHATADNFRKAAEKAVDGTTPQSDVHASTEYRARMIKVITRRTLELALARINLKETTDEP